MNVRKLFALLALFCLMLLVAACNSAPPLMRSQTPTVTTTPTPGANQTATQPAFLRNPADLSADELIAQVIDLRTAIAQRTPIPTPKHGIVDLVVEDVVDQTGLAAITFLGLTGRDWASILISGLLFVLSLAVIIPLLFRLLNWGVGRTPTRFDDDFFNSIQRELRGLIVVFVTRFLILRLDFLGEGLTTFTQDLFFILIVLLFAIIGIRLVTFSTDWLLEHRIPAETRKRFRPIINILRWAGYLFIIFVSLTLVAAHFGINISLLAPTFLLVGLVVVVIGIAAQTTITDTIHGFLILLDQPFRPGDILLIPEINNPGEVLSIGLRSTRIRAFNNREIIIPNSLIGTSQVINYSQPNQTFRQQVDFTVVGEQYEQLEQIIEKAVRGIDGVLPEKPIDVIYLSFGGTGREIRLRWWINEFRQRFFIQTKIFDALEQALEEAGLETPNTFYDLHVKEAAYAKAISDHVNNEQNSSDPNQNPKIGKRP